MYICTLQIRLIWFETLNNHSEARFCDSLTGTENDCHPSKFKVPGINRNAFIAAELSLSKISSFHNNIVLTPSVRKNIECSVTSPFGA